MVLDWEADAYALYPKAPRTPIVTDARAEQVKAELRKAGRLNADGTVSVWHVTMPDVVPQILQNGLVPHGQPSPGQDWEPEHAPYATYFHGDKGAAVENVRQARQMTEMPDAASLIECRLPVTAKALRRVIPDEDVSTDINQGLRALVRGDAVAVIGGAPASSVREVTVRQQATKAMLDDDWREALVLGTPPVLGDWAVAQGMMVYGAADISSFDLARIGNLRGQRGSIGGRRFWAMTDGETDYGYYFFKEDGWALDSAKQFLREEAVFEDSQSSTRYGDPT